MGRSSRHKPARLAEKLLNIRLRLGLTQSQMLRHLGDTEGRVYPPHISGYESGKREPTLEVLLCYARAAAIPVEVLIDDEADLPEHLPATPIVWVMERGKLWRQRK